MLPFRRAIRVEKGWGIVLAPPPPNIKYRLLRFAHSPHPSLTTFSVSVIRPTKISIAPLTIIIFKIWTNEMSERASVESEDIDFILGPIRPWSSFAFFPRLLVETSVETRTCVHTRDSVSRRPVSFPFHLPLPPLYFRNSIANASLARPNSADPLHTFRQRNVTSPLRTSPRPAS